MKLSSIFIKIYITILTVTSGSCWQFFTVLSDITLHNSAPEESHIHSEYTFGNCKRLTDIFYAHVYLDHMQVVSKIIVRGWIDILRIPTCIKIRATSHEIDQLRSTGYNFQICVPRITYCHSHHRYKYHYYEWYIPKDMVGGMNWDLYFYGPPEIAWQ